MLFSASLTVPANTLKTAPSESVLKIAHGIITKFMVRPRPGHAGLAHCVILHLEHQIAPSTQDMDISGDAFPVDWEEYYEIYQSPYELKIRGWNEDDTYPHTFDIFVAVLPKKALPAASVADVIKSVIAFMFPTRVLTREE